MLRRHPFDGLSFFLSLITLAFGLRYLFDLDVDPSSQDWLLPAGLLLAGLLIVFSTIRKYRRTAEGGDF